MFSKQTITFFLEGVETQVSITEETEYSSVQLCFLQETQNNVFRGSKRNSAILNTGKKVNAALHHLRQPCRC
jgi:hypothetical protein